jgi:hypothetical protein
MLSDTEWEQFFNLLDKIVNEEKPVNEKILQIVSKSRDNDRDSMNFEEFMAWEFGF